MSIINLSKTNKRIAVDACFSRCNVVASMNDLIEQFGKPNGKGTEWKLKVFGDSYNGELVSVSLHPDYKNVAAAETAEWKVAARTQEIADAAETFIRTFIKISQINKFVNDFQNQNIFN